MTEPNELSDDDLDTVSGGTAIGNYSSTALPKPSTTTGGGGGTAPPTPTSGGDKANVPGEPSPIKKGFGIG